MAEYVIMPKLGFNMDEGRIVRWLKKEGDIVSEQEVILEIETDKAVMEVEASASGYLRKILASEDEIIPVTLPIGIIAEKDEDIQEMIKEAYQKLGRAEKAEAAKPSQTEEKQERETIKKEQEFKKISPRARKKAKELGIEVELLKGSGPEGVVTEKDVLSYYESQKVEKKPIPSAEIEEIVPSVEIGEKIPYAGMRKIIGERLSTSKFTAPHIYFSTSIDMSGVREIRAKFNKKIQIKLSFNDFVVLAVAKALKENPRMNSSLIDGEIVLHKRINIGVAVALEEGLIVPVIRDADKKSLTALSREIKSLVESARKRKLSPDEYHEGTFTVSNLGMYGIEQFTAIINPPEAGILAVGAIKRVPVVIEEEEKEKIEVHSIMKATLSVDHRLIDGAVAVKFLNQVKEYLEFPESLIL